MRAWLIAAVVLTTAGACTARHVVVEPGNVAALSDEQWVITSEPSIPGEVEPSIEQAPKTP